MPPGSLPARRRGARPDRRRRVARKLRNPLRSRALREAARALAITVTVVARALMRRPDTILNRPGELGLLFRALAACVVAIPRVVHRQARGPKEP
jgi:hypothetical protein